MVWDRRAPLRRPYPREVVEERSADHRRRWSTGLDATSRSRRSLICDCRGQDAHRWRDAVLRRAGEAQHETALARAADVVRREGRRMDLAFERVPARRYVVGTKLEPRDEVEARLGVVVDREEIVRLAANGLDEGGPPSGIEDAHATEVRREAAFGEEARRCAGRGPGRDGRSSP